jgi:hypothetical protein
VWSRLRHAQIPRLVSGCEALGRALLSAHVHVAALGEVMLFNDAGGSSCSGEVPTISTDHISSASRAFAEIRSFVENPSVKRP